MNNPCDPLSKEPTLQETAALLHRIASSVEKDRRNRWAEITCAIVLALATTCSAWCAYQSTLWSGVQTFRLAAANKAGRESAAEIMAALQMRAFDASMFISYIQAKHDGNEHHEKFLFNRFRPEMKKAVDAWLQTDPFHNPQAPLTPFKMSEYVQPELGLAKQHEERSTQEHAAGERANENSDRYVLLTVLFASVLFFGGIAGTLDSRRLRIIVLSIAILLFIVTLSYLGFMPICYE